MTISPINRNAPLFRIKSDIFITTCVGAGSSASRAANCSANVGTTNVISAITTKIPTMITMTGYVNAFFTLRLRRWLFSSVSAKRAKIPSRIPPASPAATMLQYKESNTFGCCESASAKEEPPLIDWVSLCTTFFSSGFSHWASRMFKHCNIGRPAEHMDENIRVKRVMSSVLMPEPILSLISVGFFFKLVMTKRRRSKRASASALSLASRVPSKLLPCEFCALYKNSGIDYTPSFTNNCSS